MHMENRNVNIINKFDGAKKYMLLFLAAALLFLGLVYTYDSAGSYPINGGDAALPGLTNAVNDMASSSQQTLFTFIIICGLPLILLLLIVGVYLYLKVKKHKLMGLILVGLGIAIFILLVTIYVLIPVIIRYLWYG